MSQLYRFASWNVNGLRAVLKKEPSFTEIAAELDADILAIQETKLQQGQAEIDLPGYHEVWSYAERKGYSGTAVFTREEPLSVRHADAVLEAGRNAGLSDDALELVAAAATEGRVCALEFERFWFVNVYTPNAQNELARIDVRMAWDDAYRAFLLSLEAETGKPVITCGDFNVAHNEIDLKNPKSNRGNAGFSDEERAKFTKLLEAGYTDTFRMVHPDLEGAYSWWSYRFNARKNNAGWRIDYFLVSDAIAGRVHSAGIRNDIFGSDHCPVTLEIEL
ncbi:exodeoxyribonuclease III [Collinsella provencensis]|uniref:exodeoxyribonuclease III n=1 Tax=Collinsella provencensis TaxID=1937461 RepID=UPI000C8237F8|nr:exodeoxyribonuclease III [Collinsella provencensis]